MPDTRDEQQMDPGGVLGIAHGPAPQSDRDRALRHEDEGKGRLHEELDEEGRDRDPVGGPEPPAGLHVED
jgi:hypothetical protein